MGAGFLIGHTVHSERLRRRYATYGSKLKELIKGQRYEGSVSGHLFQVKNKEGMVLGVIDLRGLIKKGKNGKLEVNKKSEGYPEYRKFAGDPLHDPLDPY